jgi:hypothetical protein
MLQSGDLITNSAPFVTPTGVHFPKDTVFGVKAVGSRNALCYAQRCGTLVWVDLGDGVFVCGSEQTPEQTPEQSR